MAIADASLSAAQEAGGTDAGTGPDNGELVVQIEMSQSDYNRLLKGASDAGMQPEAFLIRAINEGAFLAEQRGKGNRILVQSRRGLRELVD
ncbi:MAG TPA: hypothetical protein VHB02_01330 [Acidimicrobiales bacterium]|nr:hypothetical protein [Acidimicrobiales bacterium]